MAVIYLVKRVAYGLETDKFVFAYNGKQYTRYYGDRIDDLQAIKIFRKEVHKRFSESQT